jgi:hypothetical protein
MEDHWSSSDARAKGKLRAHEGLAVVGQHKEFVQQDILGRLQLSNAYQPA